MLAFRRALARAQGSYLRKEPFPARIHGTLVLTEESVKARLYLPERTSVDAVLVVGSRFQSIPNEARPAPQNDVFDRQVRAFGSDIQQVLSGLHVGIVGLGGTGSPLAEQIVRLGVGNVSLFDGDTFDPTNINRVYGSHATDRGEKKVDIAKRSLDAIGLGTRVIAVPEPITEEHAARKLRDCDVVFGCTDKETPRAVLTQLSLKYLIPLIDLGVLIDSENGQLRGVHARATTFYPGEACLFCRGRISPETIRIESLSPEERTSQVREGYAPELDSPAPAVIAFTTAIASVAVSEFLHRLTGFMGNERQSSEVLISFDESRMRTNRLSPRESCLCTDQGQWGRGDETPYLGLSWPTHAK